MNKNILASTLCGVLAATFLLTGCSKPADKGAGTAGKVELKSLTERVSYMLGADIGASLRTGKTEVVPALISRGLEDSYQGKPLLLNEAEIEKVKQEFTEKLQQDYLARTKELATKNKTAGEAFLAENKKKAGVVTTASGLQYQVLTEGKGAKPGANAAVKVHYSGTLLDGKEFDSSYKRGEPVTIKLGEVIPGWSEALRLMKVGGKYKLFVPAALAYGEKEVGQVIGPNSTLIFEVELLGIE
ncbi:MAG: FKBP-type peptidyl-prolyl cis-trans isomerase [Desulfobulbaceae bacterium]|nr:FKBP-type peptidyl-prolyl cis-trans isomerase [Desulfobulbaceae bacterium]